MTDGADEIERLTQRVRHLELLVEDLQDAHYRRTTQLEAEIAALRKALRPEVLAQSLATDVRRRGL